MNSPPPKDDPPQQRVRWSTRCLLPCLSAIPILLVYLALPGDRMHEDEIYWVGSAYYYDLAVIQRDASSPDWQLLPARENPALGKFVIGAALHALGRRIETPDLLGSFYLIFANVPNAWGTGEALRKRRSVAIRVDPAIAQQVLRGGRLPIDEGDVRVVRRLMCLLGMLGAVGICVIGRQCDATLGGLIAGVMFGLHPIVIPAYSLAMIDMAALCFSIWFVSGLIAIIAISDCNRFTRATLVVITGVLLALACGSKMNSLVVVGVAAVCGLFLVIRWRRDHRSSDRSAVIRLAAVFLIAGVAFVSTNPSLYVNPVDGILALSYEHRLTADIQEQMQGGRLISIWSRLVALSQLVCGTPGLFLVLLGAVAWQFHVAYRDQSRFLVVVAWWLVAFAMLLAWLPFAWDRYALPLVPPTVLVAGAALEDLIRLVWGKLRQPNLTTER